MATHPIGIQVLQRGKFQTGRPAAWAEGDWNEDGIFDPSDLVAALQAGRLLGSAGVNSQIGSSEGEMRGNPVDVVILDHFFADHPF